MKKNIEVEIMGPLNKKEFTSLNKFMKRDAKFLGERDRFTLMYFKNKIPKYIGEIKGEKVDLRLRISNKKAEIVLKYGLFGYVNKREEIIIPIELSKFDEAIRFLKYLGWTKTVVYATKTYMYKYKNTELVITDIKDFGYSYEIEIMVNSEKDVSRTENELFKIIKDLNLRKYTKEGFDKQCNDINNTKELQIDFKEESFSRIKNKFKKFF